MGLILDALRKHNSAYKDYVDNNTPLFSARTDFTIYDYMNGTRTPIPGPNGTTQHYLNIGMVPGIHSSIGKSQSGKTSLFVKLCGNIVLQYPNSQFYFRDVEKTTTQDRLMALTGFSAQQCDNLIDYRRYDINHDTVYSDLRSICQTKESLRDQIMINTGFLDHHGKPIKIFPPDVYLVDSLPALAKITDDEEIKDDGRELFDVKDVSVNRKVEGMQTAGDNKQLLTKILDLTYKYNIRVILINHITTNMNIGSIIPVSKVMQYLKQSEKLPGGSSYLYLCTNITRTDFVARLDDGEYGPMIHGTRNKITMIKNKNNLSGVPIPVIFSQEYGYISSLSNFEYIASRGYGLDIKGRNISFKIYPDVSFTKKTLYESLIKDVKEHGKNSPLLKALTVTTQRCLFYDFCLHTPDPNPNNWINGIQTLSYSKGSV